MEDLITHWDNFICIIIFIQITTYKGRIHGRIHFLAGGSTLLDKGNKKRMDGLVENRVSIIRSNVDKESC